MWKIHTVEIRATVKSCSDGRELMWIRCLYSQAKPLLTDNHANTKHTVLVDNRKRILSRPNAPESQEPTWVRAWLEPTCTSKLESPAPQREQSKSSASISRTASKQLKAEHRHRKRKNVYWRKPRDLRRHDIRRIFQLWQIVKKP